MESTNNCLFESSQIYSIIRYPVMCLKLSAVYVPHLCLCRNDVSDTWDHSESLSGGFPKVEINRSATDMPSKSLCTTSKHLDCSSSDRRNEIIDKSCGRRLFQFCSELFGNIMSDPGRENLDGARQINNRPEYGELSWTSGQQDGKDRVMRGGVGREEMVEGPQRCEIKKALSSPPDTMLGCNNGTTDGESSRREWRKGLVSGHEDSTSWKVLKAFYSSVFFLIRLADLCRCAYLTFRAYGDDAAFVYSLTQLISFSYCLLLYATTCTSCAQGMSALLGTWLRYEQKYGLHPSAKDFVKTSKTIFILIVLLQLVHSLGYLVGLFSNNDLFRAQLWPYFDIDGGKRVYGIVLVSLTSYLAFSILISSTFFLYVALKLLRMEFARLREDLSSIFRDAPEEITERRFENFIERLGVLRVVLDRTYVIIKHMVALVYICVVPYLCCITYGVVCGATTTDQYIVVAYSVLLSLFLLVFTTLHCGYVYSEARSVWSVVYMFPWYRLSEAMVFKVSVFVHQLSVDSLGITVYGVFQVDRSSFLTIGGAIITYIVIVIQFKLDDGSLLVNGSHLVNGTLRCCSPGNVTC